MKANEQTIQQVGRFIKKIVQKFPCDAENAPMTDIHVRISQETGDIMAFDDDDNEITRCVVEQWIDNKEDDFYRDVTNILHKELSKAKLTIENLGIIKPYSFVLEDDEKENIAELYVVDDDTVIIGGDIMKDLDKDLDSFFNDLMKE